MSKCVVQFNQKHAAPDHRNGPEIRTGRWRLMPSLRFDVEVPSQRFDVGVPSQRFDVEVPSQRCDVGVPSQRFDVDLERPLGET